MGYDIHIKNDPEIFFAHQKMFISILHIVKIFLSLLGLFFFFCLMRLQSDIKNLLKFSNIFIFKALFPSSVDNTQAGTSCIPANIIYLRHKTVRFVPRQLNL